MAKIVIEGEEMEENCTVDKEYNEYFPACYDTELDFPISEIEFSEEEIEQLIAENPEKVAELLVRDKKFFAEVMKYMERMTVRAGNGNKSILEFVRNQTHTQEV